MSDIKKTILLEVDIDNSDAERRMAQLTQEIDKLKTANKENTKETQAQRIEVEKNNVAIKSAQQEYNNLKSTLVSNTNAAKANKGSYTELYNQWKAAEAQLKNMAGAFKTNENGVIELTQEYHDQSKAVDDLKKNLLLFNAGISQGNLNVGNYGNTLEGMRMQLQQMRADLEKVEVGSQAFTELKNKIDDTSTSIQIAEGKIDTLGGKIAKNKIKDNFNDLQSSAMAATAAIGVLSLGMGTESKAGETLRQITIGLTIAQAALTIKQSQADVQATLLTIKTKALAAAQWALNNAVAAFSIVGAIGLVAAIIKITKAQRTQNEETQIALDQQAKWAAQRDAEIQKELKNQEKIFEGFSKANQRRAEINLAESKGIDQTKERISLLQDEIDSYQTAIDANANLDKANKELGAFNKLLNKDEIAALKELIFNRQIELNQLATRRKELTDKDLKKTEEELLKARESSQESIEPITELYYRQNLVIDKLSLAIKTLYGEDVLGGLMEYNGLLQEEETALKGVEQVKKNLQEINDKEDADRDARLKKQQEQIDLTVSAAKQMGEALGNVLTDSEDRVKDFNKQILLITIKALKNQLEIAMAAGVLKELASKGFAGIVTGAILSGVMEAAFGVAINSIEGFATGGKIKGGTPINRANGDNVLITAKTGEVIMNETQQRKLQSVAGRDVFTKLGIPGFDTGGVIGNGINTTVNNALSLAEMRSLNSMLRNQPAPVIVYSEFENFKQRVEFAERAGSLV